ncbi:MAG: NAD(P)/FAD-dependent oxidoreductase [Candidatus Rokuibacteriota bacterium]
MSRRPDRQARSVVVIGGGLIGLSAAFHLRRADAGARVTVLERACVGAAASGASAAGVRVMGRDPAERAMALESLRRWPDLDRELEAGTGYRRGGGLRVALDDDEWNGAPALVAEQRADGVPVELVDAGTAQRLAPGLPPSCRGAIHCPIDGQAEAEATVRAFATAVRRLGARIEEGVGAAALVTGGDGLVAVTRTDGGREPCDVAIVAAGAWSRRLLAGIGVELPLAARALQMLLTDPAPPTLVPVLSRLRGGLSLKQVANGGYLIGGGWPARIVDEAENRWEVLEESVRSSLDVARTVYPPLAERKVVKRWAGIEAFSPDGLPLIGSVAGIPGVLVAAGFCGHGFALAPVVGDVLARLALGLELRRNLWSGLSADRPMGALAF